MTISAGSDITITGVTAARTLTMNENLTVGGGTDVTITAEDAAGTITLDNSTFEVEDATNAGNAIKIINANDDTSKTITLNENLIIGAGNDGTVTFTAHLKLYLLKILRLLIRI